MTLRGHSGIGQCGPCWTMLDHAGLLLVLDRYYQPLILFYSMVWTVLVSATVSWHQVHVSCVTIHAQLWLSFSALCTLRCNSAYCTVSSYTPFSNHHIMTMSRTPPFSTLYLICHITAKSRVPTTHHLHISPPHFALSVHSVPTWTNLCPLSYWPSTTLNMQHHYYSISDHLIQVRSHVMPQLTMLELPFAYILPWPCHHGESIGHLTAWPF